jgi:hypothetical protein
MAAAQVATEDAWWRLANVAPGSRFDEPTVVDVDFPTVALSEAWWDGERGVLTVTPEPLNDARAGEPTSFRVINVDDPSGWFVETDDGTAVESAGVNGALEVRTTSARRRHLIRRRH